MQTLGLIELLVQRQVMPNDAFGKTLIGACWYGLNMTEADDLDKLTRLRRLLRTIYAAHLNSNGQGRIQEHRVTCNDA